MCPWSTELLDNPYGELVDESRKRVIGIMASILAARKLAQHECNKRFPATICAIADAVRWAEEIMKDDGLRGAHLPRRNHNADHALILKG
jgi:hypothetical protein